MALESGRGVGQGVRLWEAGRAGLRWLCAVHPSDGVLAAHRLAAVVLVLGGGNSGASALGLRRRCFALAQQLPLAKPQDHPLSCWRQSLGLRE